MILAKLLSIDNLKTYLIIAGIILAIWFFKDYQYQKAENIRQTENLASIRKQDSLNFASQTYNKKELEEYLEYNRRDLRDFLEQHNIRTRRIENIITQRLQYRDRDTTSVNLQPILNAIKEKRDLRVPVIDSTACMIIKGWVVFEGDSLSLDITDKQFRNTSDVISYWERNQWRFLGIKTRIFGKKTATVIIKDECGETKTFVVNKK
jgi:hypothetical protein